MKATNPGSYEDTVIALEAVLKLLEKKSARKADAGACLWRASMGARICVRLTPADCKKIPGAVFVGGSCETALARLNLLMVS